MNAPAFSYDEVPYSSFTFPQTRPDRLATLAAFHGMNPAAPEKCRVLELGCGDGTNLLSFAHILPESSFVGVDLSKVHIDSANRGAGELGLRNLDFHCEDVMNFSRERFGEFDYIIAHGLFSWVPGDVQSKILEIYAECLAPHGVGYISYNIYPGCKIREMMWEMMRFHTADVQVPTEKVAGGVQFLNFLNYAAEKETPYQTILNNQLAHYSQRTVENIYHDDFASFNRPLYFHEFASMIKPHGLQFLSEVNAYWTESKMRPEVAAKLEGLGDDLIRKEQYIDFINGTPFRSSLICRDSIALERDPGPEILRSFFLASHVEPNSGEPDLTSSAEESFSGSEGGSITSAEPLTKSALYHLHRIWSASCSFDELMHEASALAGGATDEQVAATAADLLTFFKQGFVYLHRYRPQFSSTPDDKPAASRFVQWQVRKKMADITALSGMNLKLDGDLMRLMLLLCDGTRTQDDLVGEVAKRIKFAQDDEGELNKLPAEIDRRLDEFARFGLLEN